MLYSRRVGITRCGAEGGVGDFGMMEFQQGMNIQVLLALCQNLPILTMLLSAYRYAI